MDDSGIKAELVSEIEEGEKYVIVVRNNNDQTKYYAVTSEIYNGNRLVGLLVTRDGNEVTLKGTDTKAVWTISTYVTPEADASFFSAFMGSMRYYYNTIDPGDMPVETPNIVQALMVYVYKDRVELHMKNYNRSGTINGITVNKQLAPYISYRKVSSLPTSVPGVQLKDVHVEPLQAYDLMGRKVAHPTSPGVYLVNGKKKLVK